MLSLHANRVIAFLNFQLVKSPSPRPKLLTAQEFIGDQMPPRTSGTLTWRKGVMDKTFEHPLSTSTVSQVLLTSHSNL